MLLWHFGKQMGNFSPSNGCSKRNGNHHNKNMRQKGGYRFQDTLEVSSELATPPGPPSRASKSSASYRDLFADYFVNTNPLEWQDRVALG